MRDNEAVIDNQTEEAHNLSRDYMKTPDAIAKTETQLKVSTNKAMREIQKYCRDNPGKAMGIAAGVGALVSLILVKAISRKKSANDQIISGLLQKGEEVWDRLKNGFEPTLSKIKDSIDD